MSFGRWWMRLGAEGCGFNNDLLIRRAVDQVRVTVRRGQRRKRVGWGENPPHATYTWLYSG